MEIVIILDFDSHYSQEIARKVREYQVYSEVIPWNKPIDQIADKDPKGIILSRVPESKIDPQIYDLGIPILGLGFDPELTDPKRNFYAAHIDNDEVIANFLIENCKCKQDWTMKSFVENSVVAIRKQIGDKKVVCGLSGGLDSSVAAVLVHKAVGTQLTCIYVDNGFMRKGETEQVVETFGKDFKMNLVAIDAKERFLGKMTTITDPEQKRKIIGTEFIRVFEDEAIKLGKVDFLVQGTIYADIIESGTDQAAVIKSHHNVGGLPEDLKFELVEPLRMLFKDEVRLLAQELGLSDDIVWRHPFPGPGLAIRVIGEVTQERLDILQEVDAIYLEEIRKAGLYRKIWQAFAVLTNTRTVGIKDEQRTYDYVVALRAVGSEDGMTAEWSRIPHEVLANISTRIMDEVKGVNRVTYDISAKPPGTIEWE